MKKIVVIISIIGCSWANAQTTDTLDINNIKATINSNSPLFYNTSNNSSGFEVPKNSGKETIYTSGIWIGGLDDTGGLHLSAQHFGIGNDFRGGLAGSQFNRLWNVHKDSILYHINNFGQPGYTPPESVLNWPAHGNTALNEDYYMAPFVDLNGNSIYEPMAGDYPDIKGDQAIWWAMWDDTVHTESGGVPLNIEVHGMAYAYECIDSALANTVFVDYTIINKSTNTYNDVFIGNFVDFDLGSAFDDYVGVNIEHGFFYAYNGDNNDEGPTGYGQGPPIQAVMCFGPLADPDGIDNPGPSINNNYHVTTNNALQNDGIPYANLGLYYGDGITDNERLGVTHTGVFQSPGSSATTDPYIPSQYYNYLTGYWNNGQHWIYSGNGYPPGSLSDTVETNFLFPGDSDPQYWATQGDTVPYWDMASALIMPGDYRGIGSTGPITMNPGGSKEVTFAYVFARDYNDTTNTGAMDEIILRCDYIHGFIEQNLQCGQPVGISEPESTNEFQLYPNPANDFITVKAMKRPDRISIFNGMGQLVFETQPKANTTTLDLSNLSPGVYFVAILKETNLITKKVIIQ